jgi:hypothetical protein
MESRRFERTTGDRHRRTWIRAVLCMYLLIVMGACRKGTHEELTRTSPYSDLIGAEYEVATDDLYAYGIYESLPGKTANWVALVPAPGIDGPEVAFRRHVQRGQVVRILSVWRQPVLLEEGIYYVVAAPGADLPGDIPIRLELLGANETGPGLNPQIYKKREETK